MTRSPGTGKVSTAEHVAALGVEHGEGPQWSEDTQRLSMVDTTGRSVLVLFESGLIENRFHHEFDIGAAIPADGGGFLLCDQPGLVHIDAAQKIHRLLSVNGTDSRMNDAKVAPDGSLWVGSMSYDFAPGAGCLYRWDGGDTAETLLSGCTVPNGLDWSAEGQFYFADSSIPALWRYSLDGTRPAASEVFADLPAKAIPDGLCLDVDGCVWVALFGSGQVHRYGPDGSLLQIVQVPVAQVTSCAFGGSTLSTLFITTSRLGLDPATYADQPHAGDLFAISTNTSGYSSRKWSPRPR